MLIEILIWIFFWFLSFGIIFYIKKQGYDYVTNPIRIALIYALFCILVLMMFDVIFGITLPIILLYIFIIIVEIYTYKYLRKHKHKVPDIDFLKFDNKFFFPKFFEIWFQQMMIFILVIFLNTFFSITTTIILFAFLFCVIHAPLIFFINKKIGEFLIIASFFGGIVFPWIILNYGLAYSFLIHWLFYFIAGIFYWKYQNNC